MLDVGPKEFSEARVYAMTVGKRKLYWVRVYDIQKRLGIENMSDLVRKTMFCPFESNKPSKEEKRKYKRCGKESFNDLIFKIIMNNRGSKKKGGQEEASEFKRKLGFKEHNIIMSK